MKTIDEVIESITKQSGLEIRNVRKPDKDRFWVDRETYMDALHYLREYRDKHDEMLKTEEALGYCEMAENRPLTWDELRTMEEKPVWIEADNGQEQFKHWFIIDEFTYSDIPGLQIMWCLNNSFRFWEADIGKTWQAYRKEKRS